MIDENLRTDLNWIKKLTQREENAKEMLEELLFENELGYDYKMIRSKFNMKIFYENDLKCRNLIFKKKLMIRLG